ncbi:MAG TPA: hypothetical protein VFR86_09200 [Burkholderiaceae bacterium]|nr:hypothetical protein [Burkholderiaceae bacterium]
MLSTNAVGMPSWSAALRAVARHACRAQCHQAAVDERDVGHDRCGFTDPMTQPFVILKGLADGRITDEIADVFASRRQLRLSID